MNVRDALSYLDQVKVRLLVIVVQIEMCNGRKADKKWVSGWIGPIR